MKNYMNILMSCLICIQLTAQKSSDFREDKTAWMSIETSQQISAKQLAQDKATLQLTTNDDLKLLSSHEDNIGFHHDVYQQTYKGVPIEGAIYLIHEKNGLAKHANGKLIRNLDLSTNPSLNEITALQKALQYTNATTYAWQDLWQESILKDVKGRVDATFYPNGELVIIDPEFELKTENYQLVYKFDIYATAPLSRELVYVDAHTGEVLATVEKIHHCTEDEGTIVAATNYSGMVDFTACTDGNLESNLYIDAVTFSQGGIKVFDANNAESYPQILATYTDPTATEVFWATQGFFRYFGIEHNRVSLDGNDMPLHSWVHYGNDYNNAFWNGAWMTYGDGDGSLFNPLTSPDVVGHEMMHGVTDFSGGLIYWGESGALNESFSDIFGEVLEEHLRGATDWILGGDFTVQGGGIRNMSNPNDPNMLTQQPDTYNGNYWYTGQGDNGGVHFNSGVQNYWFYLLSQGGSGINDNGDAYIVEGIGMDKAAAIAYRNLTEYLTPNSNYQDAGAGALQAAMDLYGGGSNEAFQTQLAWCAVGVDSGTPCSLPTATCRMTDSLALVALYNSLDGSGWVDLIQPMDTWYGVTLNSSGCVTRLDLAPIDDCVMRGGLPAEIGDLQSLTHLIINYMTIGCSNTENIIPPEIGNLTNLIHLELAPFQLTGNIPPEIGNLTNLEILNLSDNQLTGNIPAEIGNLTNLNDFRIENNQLSGCYPPNLFNICWQITNTPNTISDGK